MEGPKTYRETWENADVKIVLVKTINYEKKWKQGNTY